MIGRVFAGRYRITEKIGTGGMAEVFKAQDETLGRTVAVKVMLPQYANDSTFAARFRQEAQAAANLSSPYIVNIYDWGQDNGTYFIVMEYVRGVNLKAAIEQRGAISPQKAAEIGSQVCSALAVAHGYDIIHRDIKPHNIMVQPDGNAKVMDFGIARAGNSSLTQTSSVLGTAHYVSPEQAQGQTLAPTSDLYSLGIVLYEATTARLPFNAPDAVAVAMKQVKEQPIPPSQINPAVDSDLEAIILCAMEKQREARFQSAIEMRNALNSYLAGRPIAIANEQTAVMSPSVAPLPLMADSTSTMDPIAAGSEGYNRRNVQRNFGHLEEEKPKKKWPVIAAVIGVIAVIGILAVVFGINSCTKNTDKTVPSIIGMTQQDAERMIKESGFALGTVTPQTSETVATGVVIAQDPQGKTKASEGKAINITVSTGKAAIPKVAVPDLTGMTQSQAETALTNLKLTGKANDAQYNADVEPGKIFKQDPAGGTEIEEGGIVHFTMSLGTEDIEIPKVTGMTQATATTTLQGAGFTVEVSEEYSSSVTAGEVVWQDPNSGTKIVKGSTVKIGISKGPEPIKQVEAPSLIGMTEDAARTAANGLGLTLKVTYQEDPKGTDLIDEQDIAAGTKVDVGTVINVKVLKKKATEPVAP